MARNNTIESIPETDIVERYRATPLRPAVWMTGVLVWATVVALFLHVPTWAGVFLCVVTGASFFVYLVSYVYLMASDRDALRAERYRARVGSGTQRVEAISNVAWPAEQEQPFYVGPQITRSVARLPAEEAEPATVNETGHVVDQ